MASTSGIRAGRAFVELFADDSQLVRGLRRAEKKLKAFGASIRKLGLMAVGIGTAVLAPLAASAKLFSRYGDQVAKMAKRTGLSVETLSELRFVASQTGTEFQSLEMGFRRMQRSIYDAGRGLSTAKDALADLDLAFKDLDGLSPEDQFKLLADRIGSVEDPTKKAAIAMTLFGRTGTNLLPMFAAGSAGIEALQAEARKLGLTMSGEDAKAAEDFTDALDQLWKVVRMGVFNIGAALAPALQRMADTITRVAVTVSEWVKQNRGLIVQVAKIAAIVVAAGVALIVLGALISGLGAVLGLLATLLSGAAAAFGVMATFLGLLLSPIGLVIAAVTGLGATILIASGAAGEALSWLGDRFGELSKTAGEAFGAIANAVAHGNIDLAFKVLWSALKLLWQQGLNFLTQKWVDFKTGFLKLASDGFFGAAKIAVNAFDAIRSAFAITTGFLAKQLLKLQGLFDETLDVQGAISLVDQEANAQLAKIGRENLDTIAQIETNARAERSQLDTEAAARIADAEAELAKARSEFEASVAEANAPGPGGSPGPASGADVGDRLRQLLDSLADGSTTASLRNALTVRGTFNAAAIQGLMTDSGVAERTAKATEDTARNTKRIERAINDNAIAFA
jgi:hypothetical protein